MAGAVLDFGPVWYVTATAASDDVDGDGDGMTGTIAEEIAGLEGDDIAVRVNRGAGGDAPT